MEIQELPDYKAYRSEIDKYLDEPLFEYVWKVADMFMPDYDCEERCPSRAPVIFANRYIESRLTDEEKYARYLEMYPNDNLESAKEYYAERTELDTSFKETFFSKKEVIKTLKAFHIDLNKFWYLLLFVHDLVMDVCTDAPDYELSEVDKINQMARKISEAPEIKTIKNGRESDTIRDEYMLSILKASIRHFIRSYNEIVNTSKGKELKVRLEELGITDKISSLVPIKFEEKVTLDKSHKTRLFAAMFQYFLRDKEADHELTIDFTRKDSVDKLLLISRLAYIVGFEGEEYYERHISNKEGKFVANRRLSNLLSRYRNEPLPPMTGRIYSDWF